MVYKRHLRLNFSYNNNIPNIGLKTHQGRYKTKGRIHRRCQRIESVILLERDELLHSIDFSCIESARLRIL